MLLTVMLGLEPQWLAAIARMPITMPTTYKIYFT
jgi:hypothetical protein